MDRTGILRGSAALVAGVLVLGGVTSCQGSATPPSSTRAAAGATRTPAPTPAPLPTAVRNYRAPREVSAVAAPVRIEIPALDVQSDLERVGKQADGTIGVPRRPSRAAWYVDSAPPGQVGASVVLGHVDSKTGPAVFYRLHELRPGDSVKVRRADRSWVSFVVDKVEEFDKDEFPSVDVYFPTVRPTLRLITCAGDYDRSDGGYQSNVIVFASIPKGAP